MDRSNRHGNAAQQRRHERGVEDAVAGKTTRTGSLAPSAVSAEGGAPSPRWPAASAYVAEGVARAHGLVRFDPSAPPVQALSPEARDLAAAARDAGGGAQAIADRGFSGGGGSLPHLDTIQAAFGRHDVSAVQAHVGGAAAEAAHDLGAVAYASGDRVAFERAPDLFVAAHEAAHVVQQRGGVQLAGGVGEVGDAYERHADEVAAAVVRGESAEPLLDRHAGGGGGGECAAVQQMSDDEARLMLTSFRALPQAEQRRQVRGWSESYTADLLGSISARDRREFRAEIAAIERIRSEQAAAGDQTPEEPSTGGAPDAGASPQWEAFARAFDGHFPDDVVRHFRAGAQAAQMDEDGRRRPGQQVAALTAETMRAHFTDSQRQRMSAYFENLRLSERLFNTGEHGPAGLSVVQRRLMSAHMLAVGTFERSDLEQQRQQAQANRDGEGGAPADAAAPGAEQAAAEQGAPEQGGAPLERAPAGPQQRIRARMCMHWVHLVNAYAGAGSGARDGVMGNFDHDNNVVLHADHGARSERSSNTPRGDNRDAGPPFTKEDIDRIQPGDWLYIAMPTMHSVVFSQFVDTEWPTRGVQFKTIVTYDQGGVNASLQGGSRHVRRIGPVATSQVKTVHRRQSGGDNARPAETPADVVPQNDRIPPGQRGDGVTGTSVEEDNNNFMRARGIRPEDALRRVRADNQRMIDELRRIPNRHGEPCLDASQAALLGQTNDQERLETRVRLNERLRILVEGARNLSATNPPGAGTYEQTQGSLRRARFNRRDTPTTGLLRRIWSSVP